MQQMFCCARHCTFENSDLCHVFRCVTPTVLRMELEYRGWGRLCWKERVVWEGREGIA